MGEYTKADSMASVNAREATVIHEFMHVNMVGFRKMCTLTLSTPRYLITSSQFLASITKQANIDDVVAATPIFPDPWVGLVCHIHLVAANHDATYSESVWRLPPSRLGLERYQGGRKRYIWQNQHVDCCERYIACFQA